MTRIEWDEPVDAGHGVRIRGRIGGLEVAVVHPDTSRQGDWWWVTVNLAPLPYELNQMTRSSKPSEKGAKMTAQRVVNAFTKILNGEA